MLLQPTMPDIAKFLYMMKPPFKETREYVVNVFKYYTFYKIEYLRKQETI